jgi:hypothetical protein
MSSGPSFDSIVAIVLVGAFGLTIYGIYKAGGLSVVWSNFIGTVPVDEGSET